MIQLTKKQYSPDIKMQIVKEAMETGNASIVARRHNIAPSLVACWARCYSGSKCSVKKNELTLADKIAVAQKWIPL